MASTQEDWVTDMGEFDISDDWVDVPGGDKKADNSEKTTEERKEKEDYEAQKTVRSL